MTIWADNASLALYSRPSALADYRKSLVAEWLTGRSPRTRAGYADDAKRFAEWLGAPGPDDAAKHLLSLPLGEANGLILSYRNAMRDEGKLAPATINRRLAAVRSMVKFARMLGLVTWALEVPNLRAMKYKDTRGPGAAGAKDMLEASQGSSEPMIRARALIRVLYDLGLRRFEASGCSWEHYRAADRRLSIVGKGHHIERQWLDVPDKTAAALNALRLVRGMPSTGPIFVSVDRVHPGHRLTGESIYQVILAAGKRAGYEHVAPHGLRHAAITAVLDATNGNTRSAQRFSRHAEIKTLGLYDDNREAIQGQMADLIAL